MRYYTPLPSCIGDDDEITVEVGEEREPINANCSEGTFHSLGLTHFTPDYPRLYNASITWEIQVPVNSKANDTTTWLSVRHWTVSLDKLSNREFKHFFDFNGTSMKSTHEETSSLTLI